MAGADPLRHWRKIVERLQMQIAQLQLIGFGHLSKRFCRQIAQLLAVDRFEPRQLRPLASGKVELSLCGLEQIK